MPRIYRFGDYQLNAERRALSHRSAPVPITARAFDILHVLLEERHRVVEKDELLSRVWPDQIVEEGNLTQQIFVLRRLLGSEQYIATVPRRGYQFVAAVDEIGLPDAQASATISARALRLDIALNPPIVLGPNPALAISRDGGVLVYVGEHEGSTALFARRLDGYDTRLVAGTRGATSPFLSPDARWIGYTANGRLLRVGTDGATGLAICEVDGTGRGATWGADNLIVFAPLPAGPLFAIAAAGGTPRRLTRLDYESGERTHRFPSFTPDGRHVVFTIARAGDTSFDHARLAVTATADGAHHVILEGGSCGRMIGESSLHYQHGGMLFVTRFDPTRAAADDRGEPQESIATHEAGAAHAACSDAGLLVYAPPVPPVAPARLVWLDSSGKETPLEPMAGTPEEPRISPDGARVIVGVRADTSDLWMYDSERRTYVRLTETGDNFAAIWTPDGQAVVFSSNRAGPSNLYHLPIGTVDGAVAMSHNVCEQVPGSWTPDGNELLFTEYDAQSGVGLWRLDRHGHAHRLMRSRFNEYTPALSHDGQWLAYTSDASGTAEVYVVRFPDLVDRQQVSRGGGSEPVWAPRSRQLFFRTPGSLASVVVEDGGRISEPVEVAADRYVKGSLTGLPNYDVHPDGRLLLVAPPEVSRTRARLHAVVRCNAVL